MSVDGGDKRHYTSVFRLSSPPTDPRRKQTQGIIKRNRRVVSCVPCRTRKLKCDRQQPCSSCVKRHDERSCIFFVQKDPDAGHGHVRHVSPAQKNEMRAKLNMLEDLVSAMVSQSQPSSSSTRPLSQSRPQHYSAVLDSIRDLQGFVDADFASPAPARTASEQRPARETVQASHFPEVALRETLDEVLGYLPPRAECDSILASYFQQVYMIPAVCHVGQFQRMYEQFWKHPGSVSPLWLSMLFSLVSTSFYQQFAKTSPSMIANNATLVVETKKRVAECSSMAYRCLLAGSHLQGGPFSVEATLLFAMHLVLQKRDADPLCWHMIGTAVRLAQRAGYHRDATRLGRDGADSGLSPFEIEMRRRTWSYLEYFDVFFSFLLGIPPIINIDFVDVALPSNLRDEDFDEDSRALPPPRPTTELSPTLVYVFLSKQIKLLHRVVQQAIALKQPSYMEVMSLHDELIALHNEVPPGLRWRPIRESGLTDIPDLIMRRIMCETMHLKCLCVLHRRYLTFGRQNDTYDRSRKACVDASLALLQVQLEFDENSSEGGRLYERRYLLTNLGYHDFLLAAMCVCLDLTISSRDGKVRDYEPKVEALKRARTIWGRMADHSSEAHASQVLEQILSKVPSPDQTRNTEVKNRPHEPSASTGGTAVSERSIANASQLANGANCPLRLSAQSDSRGYSRQWDFGVWDEIEDRAPRGSSDGTSGLDVDWDQIDSFIFARKPGPGFAGSNGDGAPAANTTQSAEDPRQNWPYPTWNGRVDDQHGSGATPPRSCANAHITMTGFVPVSSPSGFL